MAAILGGVATGIYDAKYWRARARELRAEAEEMRDPICKQMMLQIAEDYEQLAEHRVPDGANLNG